MCCVGMCEEPPGKMETLLLKADPTISCDPLRCVFRAHTAKFHSVCTKSFVTCNVLCNILVRALLLWNHCPRLKMCHLHSFLINKIVCHDYSVASGMFSFEQFGIEKSWAGSDPRMVGRRKKFHAVLVSVKLYAVTINTCRCCGSESKMGQLNSHRKTLTCANMASILNSRECV